MKVKLRQLLWMFHQKRTMAINHPLLQVCLWLNPKLDVSQEQASITSGSVPVSGILWTLEEVLNIKLSH